ncbi:toxin-antitoxin system HicB family antitoxin [Silvibacterium sp.]|uniref:toxin-antitoxin system HicB family antitoxin n=1 Tax=Silvibacterium sp. TaxID=1964179 RepID=UPI0039E6FAF4
MAEEYKRLRCFPLRLSPTMRQQAVELAEREGISLNHFITLALAEKITRLERVQLQADPAQPHPRERRTGTSDQPSEI